MNRVSLHTPSRESPFPLQRRSGLILKGTKHHPRLGRDHRLLPAIEFLALLVPLIQLRYEVTLRCYGAISTTFRRKLGWIQHPPTKQPPLEMKPAPEFPLPPFEGSSIPFPSSPGPTLLPPSTPEASPGLDGEESQFVRKRRRSWARLIAKTWLVDPELCLATLENGCASSPPSPIPSRKESLRN